MPTPKINPLPPIEGIPTIDAAVINAEQQYIMMTVARYTRARTQMLALLRTATAKAAHIGALNPEIPNGEIVTAAIRAATAEIFEMDEHWFEPDITPETALPAAGLPPR